ncbi:MAG: DUF2057 family protein, partial [Bdellovibrionales bacterium]|nr:DUF2057 family protein [Bdellovibrionales bacterium]
MQKTPQAEDLPVLKPNQKIVAASGAQASQQHAAYNNLKDWWDKATPEERAEFQRWVWTKPGQR